MAKFTDRIITISQSQKWELVNVYKIDSPKKISVLKGDFDGIVQSMRQGWESKKRSAKTVSNPLIDEVYDEAVSAGMLGGKVSGAGGGGFMMLFVPPDKRMNVIRVLNRFEGQVSNCHFTKHGTQAWRI